jgi:hypothetical protein
MLPSCHGANPPAVDAALGAASAGDRQTSINGATGRDA